MLLSDSCISQGHSCKHPSTHRLDLVVHIALWARELSGVLDLEVHYEVQVVPHIVVLEDVVSERHVLVLKLGTRET